MLEMVLLPAPDMPVNQSVKPLCMRLREKLLEQYVDPALRLSVRREVKTAFLLRVRFPPPAARALIVAVRRTYSTRAGRAAYARIAPRVKGVHRDAVGFDVLPYLRGRPVGQRTDFGLAGVPLNLLY